MKQKKKCDFSISSTIWGIVLITVGIIYALNSLDITNINIFFKGWWTLFVIIPCTIRLITSSDNRSGSATGLLIGVFLLLCARGILAYSMIWKLLLPLLVVFLGLKLFLKGLFGSKYDEDDFDDAQDDEDDKDDQDDEVDEDPCDSQSNRKSIAMFSSHRIKYDGRVFVSENLDVVFGSVELDLRKAIIEGDCTIHANCVFGNIKILVPENTNVKVKDSSVFGGASNHTINKKGEHTLYIKSNSVFGGISVK